MPLHIIRQDITRIKCDAIVNAANNSLLGGGGVDGAIHKAAGPELLAECRTLGGCNTGDAKITKGYNLPAKFVIHTVGPIWRGGSHNERALLTSCYEKSLALSKANGCESIAFPLISSGIYGYPKAEAIAVAIEAISRFLTDNDATVYIVVFDKASFEISEALFDSVSEYIDDNYASESKISLLPNNSCTFCFDEPVSSFSLEDKELETDKGLDTPLLNMLANIDDTFAVTLLKLIDVKGITDVECYKKANVSKQTWYKIMNERSYKPSKNTVIAFAIALELSLEEANRLLSTVGFTLSKSSKFDIIIEYFLIKGEYDIFTINETLFKFDQSCLGV